MSADIRLNPPARPAQPACGPAAGPAAALVVDRPQHLPRAAAVDRPLILLVDDDADTRAVLACMLEGAGLAVLEAPDGASALRLLRTAPVTAVVLDVVLPDQSGFDVCRRLRERLGRAIPVVLMTALPSIMDEASWLLAGADVCLPKPVRRRDLLAHLAP